MVKVGSVLVFIVCGVAVVWLLATHQSVNVVGDDSVHQQPATRVDGALLQTAYRTEHTTGAASPGLSPGSLDEEIQAYERVIRNMPVGLFEHLARHVLSTEEQIALRESGHMEIQANMAILLGNAVAYERIPTMDAFVDRQKLAWTYGMNTYRAINFLEQSQYGRLLSNQEILEHIDAPQFEQLKANYSASYEGISDELRAKWYKRILDARSDPSLPSFQGPPS